MIPLDDPIKRNLFLIPGKYEEKRKEKQKKLIYSNDTMKKFRAGVEVRKEMALELFKRELFGVSKSLAETSTTHYIMEIKQIFLSDLFQLISIISGSYQ